VDTDTVPVVEEEYKNDTKCTFVSVFAEVIKQESFMEIKKTVVKLIFF